jgi:hypothetical protein
MVDLPKNVKFTKLKKKINDCLPTPDHYNSELTFIIKRWRSILEWREFSADEIDILVVSIGEKFFIQADPKDPNSPGIFDVFKMKQFTDQVLMWLLKPTIIKHFMPKDTSSQ